MEIPLYMCGVDVVGTSCVVGCTTDGSVILYGSLIGDLNGDRRLKLRLCTLTKSQRIAARSVTIEGMVGHPGNGDTEFIFVGPYQVPFSGGLIIAFPGAQLLTGAGKLASAEVVALCQRLVTNLDGDRTEARRNGRAGGIINGVELGLVCTIVVGGIKGNLVLDGLTEAGAIVITPEFCTILFTGLDQLVEVCAALLVFVNDFYIRGVAVDGHSTTKSALDDVISVVKIVEFDLCCSGFNRTCVRGVIRTTCIDDASHIGNQLRVVDGGFFGDGTCDGIIVKVIVGALAVFAKQNAKELVVGSNAVGNGISLTFCICIIGCVEQLIDRIRLTDGCVGNSDGALSICRKSGDAHGQDQNKGQHQRENLFHGSFSFL